MAQTPVQLFSRFADPDRVIDALSELGLQVEADPPDPSWRKATVRVQNSEQLPLTFVRESDESFDPNESEIIAELNDWLASFPESETRSKATMLTSTFKSVFAVQGESDLNFEAEDDPRLDVVYAVCKSLDGVLKTPTSFRDAHGRVLWSVDGEDAEDADAVWPKVIATVSLPHPLEAIDTNQPDSMEDTTALAPSADQVARRALALAAVTARATLEQHPANLDTLQTWKNRPQCGELIPRLIRSLRGRQPNPMADLFEWIEAIGIKEDLEPDEREVLQRPIGRLDQAMAVNSTWRLEGLVILSWALGRFNLPPHDKLTKFYPMWESLGLLDERRAKELLASPTLRSRDEIQTLRSRLFALHWRLRNFGLNQDVLNFEKFAAECWFGPLDISGLPLIKGDLALDSERLDKCDSDTFSTAHSVAHERHQAVNWLWEGPARYADASVAT